MENLKTNAISLSEALKTAWRDVRNINLKKHFGIFTKNGMERIYFNNENTKKFPVKVFIDFTKNGINRFFIKWDPTANSYSYIEDGLYFDLVKKFNAFFGKSFENINFEEALAKMN